jgi:hypothetical protein
MIFNQSNYQIIYEADANGKVISGNIGELLQAVQNGNPIRVGWTLKIQNGEGELKELEHWTDTKFLTIFDNMVYAQINSIYEQMTNFKDAKGAMRFVNNQPDGWVALISTSGIMRQKYRDVLAGTEGMSQEEIDKMIKYLETTKVNTKWAVSK